jgi:hypothetical protein
MTETHSRLEGRFTELIYSATAVRCVFLIERGVFVAVCLIALRSLWNEGLGGLLRDFVLFLRRLPFINSLIDTVLDGEVSGAMKLLAGQGDSEGNAAALLPIPETGVSPSDVIKVLEALKASETAAEEGKAFAYTYTTKHDMAEFAKSLGKAYELFTPKSQSGNSDHELMLTQAWDLFMHSNALNPMMYPSLRRMETEVVSMAAWMVSTCASRLAALTACSMTATITSYNTHLELPYLPHFLTEYFLTQTTRAFSLHTPVSPRMYVGSRRFCHKRGSHERRHGVDLNGY